MRGYYRAFSKNSEAYKMNEQEKLMHEIATNIFQKTGIAINTDDPLIIITLCNILLIEEKIQPFLLQLEHTTDKLNNVNQKLDTYIKTVRQVLITNGKKEISETINQNLNELIKQINQTTNNTNKNVNNKNKKIEKLLFCLILLQIICILIYIL